MSNQRIIVYRDDQLRESGRPGAAIILETLLSKGITNPHDSTPKMSILKEVAHRGNVARRLNAKIKQIKEETDGYIELCDLLLSVGGVGLGEIVCFDFTIEQQLEQQLDDLRRCRRLFTNDKVKPCEDLKMKRKHVSSKERRDFERKKSASKRNRDSTSVRPERNVKLHDMSPYNEAKSVGLNVANMARKLSETSPGLWASVRVHIHKLDDYQPILRYLPLAGAGKSKSGSHCLFKAFADFEKLCEFIVEPPHLDDWQDVLGMVASYVDSNPDQQIIYRSKVVKIKDLITKQMQHEAFQKGLAGDQFIAVWSHLNNFEICVKERGDIYTYRGNPEAHASASSSTQPKYSRPRMFLNYVDKGKGHWELNKQLNAKSINRWVERADKQALEERVAATRDEKKPEVSEQIQLSEVVVQEEVSGQSAEREEQRTDSQEPEVKPSAPLESDTVYYQEPFRQAFVEHVLPPSSGGGNGGGSSSKPPTSAGHLKEIAAKPRFHEDRKYPRVYHRDFSSSSVMPKWFMTCVWVLILALQWATIDSWWSTAWYVYRWSAIFACNYAFRLVNNVTQYRYVLVMYYTILFVGLVSDMIQPIGIGHLGMVWQLLAFLNAIVVPHKSTTVIMAPPMLFRSDKNKLTTKDDAEDVKVSETTLMVVHKLFVGQPKSFSQWLGRSWYYEFTDKIPVEVFDASLHSRQNAGFTDRDVSIDKIGRLFRTQDMYHTNFLDQYSLDHAARCSMAVNEQRRDEHRDFMVHLA